jgi:exopolysaccharide biosynthesis polyprenyl glycosylphosphotransferase
VTTTEPPTDRLRATTPQHALSSPPRRTETRQLTTEAELRALTQRNRSGQRVALTAADWQSRLSRTIKAIDLAVGTVTGAVVVGALQDGTGLEDAALVLGFPILWVLACMSTRSYEARFLGDGSEEFRRVADAGFRLLTLSALCTFVLQLDHAQQLAFIAIPLTVLATLLGRYGARQSLHRRRAQGQWLHRVLVVGRERACAELIRQLHREPFGGFAVVGVCVDAPRGTDVEGIPIVGSSMSVTQALERTGADTVAIGAWSDLTQHDLRRLSWELEGTGVDLLVAPSLPDASRPRIHIRPVAGLPLVHVEQPEFAGGRRLLKNSLDRLAALCGLALISPLLVVVGLAIRLTSPGPALFRQTRVGADGKTFTIVKFRSMFRDAEARLHDLQDANDNSDGLLFKMRDDPRVTTLGRLLRRFSIDELPQLINVVRGEMSLVGPRPPLESEVSQYSPDMRRRLLVPPGLTGLWQISGRSDLSWEDSVRLDLHYVENWSLALDLLILWRTFWVVAAKRGAY